MSNVCKCPDPPGGSVTCNDDQLAVCGYQDGQIVSGCFDKPDHLRSISDKEERLLALKNWALSTIMGVYRSEDDPIGPELTAMLASGQYKNEQTKEIVRFILPRDFQNTPKLRVRTMTR